MNEKKTDQEMYKGILPASAPLANPYIPFQRENPPRYEARRGMIRGTMYPGLDLPFMDMVNNRLLPETPLTQLQVLGFALHDLALYLDTHRDDREALEVYRAYQQLYHNGIMEYQASDKPLTHAMPSQAEEYSWLNDPWPWEYSQD